MVTFFTYENKYNLLSTINSLRKEMVRVGIEEGLNSEKTLNMSQKLDIYITKYQRMELHLK